MLLNIFEFADFTWQF